MICLTNLCFPFHLSVTFTKNCTSCKMGALPSFALPVSAWLDSEFTARWIGRVGPNEGPQCDFFFVGLRQREAY
jgi:hypothetical protein